MMNYKKFSNLFIDFFLKTFSWVWSVLYSDQQRGLFLLLQEDGQFQLRIQLVSIHVIYNHI